MIYILRFYLQLNTSMWPHWENYHNIFNIFIVKNILWSEMVAIESKIISSYT